MTWNCFYEKVLNEIKRNKIETITACEDRLQRQSVHGLVG